MNAIPIIRRFAAACLCCALLGTAARAQGVDSVDRPVHSVKPAVSASGAITPESLAAGAATLRQGGAATAAEKPSMPPLPAGPLPPDPQLAKQPLMFGSQIFSGRFANQAFSGFNAEYQIAVGDRVSVRMWGAFTFADVQSVDAQGNIFIPNVGPVHVQGVRNGDLNKAVESQIRRTFRSNVGVYAALEAAQPVKVYVTGFVRAPGLYPGLSSDSVLAYLDRAGGIDPDRGSYLEVEVLRNGELRTKVNLYDFLLDGRIPALQLQDGDTIVVAPRKHTVTVAGEVLNPYVFEFDRARISAAELLQLARPKPEATHLSIVRNIGVEQRSEYHPLADAGQVVIHDGDEVTLTSDKYPGTILVHVQGAQLGARTLVLPYGSRLQDALARLHPAPQADMAAVQLFRKSVAERQEELLETSLRGLETYALTGRSSTSEEATLRQRESQQILQFIERARSIQPKGQVILAQAAGAGETLLENNDIIRVPVVSNVVMVSGEVMFPNALIFDPQADAQGYIQRAGGLTQTADDARVYVLRRDGSVAAADQTAIHAGDEIMVMPKIESKSVEVARGITQIVYQIAVAARIALGL